MKLYNLEKEIFILKLYVWYLVTNEVIVSKLKVLDGIEAKFNTVDYNVFKEDPFKHYPIKSYENEIKKQGKIPKWWDVDYGSYQYNEWVDINEY